jgi:hypothetical protein
VNEPLASLHARYGRQDDRSVSVMNGAGSPKRILQDYAQAAGWFPKTLKLETAEKSMVVSAISDSIRAGVPVIAALRSQQVIGFVHGVIITAVAPKTGSIGFKDPSSGMSPRPFGVDVRMLQYH